MTGYAHLLGVLTLGDVKFIIVGGLAATAHGAARLTHIDVVYDRTPANIARLVACLHPHRPYLRGAPSGLPFTWSDVTIRRGLNFTLTTALGDLDLLAEITGGGDYTKLEAHTIRLELFGHSCLCLDLPTLVRVEVLHEVKVAGTAGVEGPAAAVLEAGHARLPESGCPSGSHVKWLVQEVPSLPSVARMVRPEWGATAT